MVGAVVGEVVEVVPPYIEAVGGGVVRIGVVVEVVSSSVEIAGVRQGCSGGVRRGSIMCRVRGS